jgi:glycerophosphoryl diester phosphodiesterase
MSAIKNLFIVCFIVFICLFLAWFGFKNKSLQKAHPPFENAFFKKDVPGRHPLIALRGESEEFPENSILAFEAATNLKRDAILWADLMMTSDGVIVVTRQQNLEIYGVEKSYVPLITFAELQKIDAGFVFQDSHGQFNFRGKNLHILSLKELIEHFPKSRFILNLLDDSTGFDHQLTSTLGYNDTTNRFIITSERDKILKEVKKTAPMLLYGSSAPQLTQLMILGNVMLESAAPLDADLLIVEQISQKLKHSVRILLNEKMINEAHRRHLKVFAGNAMSLNEAQEFIARGIDGIISSHPKALENLE